MLGTPKGKLAIQVYLFHQSTDAYYVSLILRVKHSNLPEQLSPFTTLAVNRWSSFDYLCYLSGYHYGLLIWALAPEIDEINAELQYVTGSLIRQFDGGFLGQTTEPDVILLGTTGIAIVECKLSEPDKALTHLWEGIPESVDKRLPIYLNEIPNLLRPRIISEEIAPVYQLVRMAFYAMKLGESFQVKPVLASIANERNWTKEIRKLRKSPAELWGIYFYNILGKDSPRCESLSWQSIRELVKATPLDSLAVHLSTHPCL